MSHSEFNKGIISAATGSLWWGILGVIYFEYISFVGHIESLLHRAIWTSLFLVITTSYLSKWNIFFEIIKIKKNLITLFFSGLLIFINWAVWIYAVSSDQIINASFGYFIMPILSVFLGYIFFKEKLNEVAVFNSNLAYATRLFTEHSTTKQEKINILRRFDSADTIKESKGLYKIVKENLESKENSSVVTESVSAKVQKSPSKGSATNLIESKTYENPQFMRMKDLMGKLQK